MRYRLKAIGHSGAKSVDGEESQSSDQKKDNVIEHSTGWGAPLYHNSRRVELDHQLLEENRLLGLLPKSAEEDYFRVLRTQIHQRMSKKGWNTLMVTSVHPGEGKSLTAINLASLFAREFNRTVLLVDADFKSQSIYRYLGYESEKGLVNYLLGNSQIKDLTVWPGGSKLTIISGGATSDDSTELLNSPKMRALVKEMKSRYTDRYIIFDLPPILNRADAIIFSELVDAIVVVVQEGKTPMPDIQKALDYIPEEKFLGFVMNQHG